VRDKRLRTSSQRSAQQPGRRRSPARPGPAPLASPAEARERYFIILCSAAFTCPSCVGVIFFTIRWTPSTFAAFSAVAIESSVLARFVQLDGLGDELFAFLHVGIAGLHRRDRVIGLFDEQGALIGPG
jgi:hypothetical protein